MSENKFILGNVTTISLIDNTTKKKLVSSEMPTEDISFINTTDKYYPIFKIKDGFKISVRDTSLENIIHNSNLLELFNLNIKRVNRWWYSIYFEERKNGNELKVNINYY